MARIVSFAVHAIELPFRIRFEHAAASRRSSESLFVELHLDNGIIGWGESLPRSYVTGETRDGACELLASRILPHLLGHSFHSFEDVIGFLADADGRAPADWVSPATPQSAAWCAVDLALLDAFGRHFQQKPLGDVSLPSGFHYSGVVSAGAGWKSQAQLLAFRAMGFRALKIKADASTTPEDIARIRRLAGSGRDLRVDLNMAWTFEQACELLPTFARQGIRSFEQPLSASDLEGAARIVRETGLDVIADESLNTAESLHHLIEQQACTGINARISKCGGLIATLARCYEARSAGLWIQVGCQVGESSLLSAAHLRLCATFPRFRHAEGCFGSLLLSGDPFAPSLRFGYRGAPPAIPSGAGLGVEVDLAILTRHRVGHWQSA